MEKGLEGGKETRSGDGKIVNTPSQKSNARRVACLGGFETGKGMQLVGRNEKPGGGKLP